MSAEYGKQANIPPEDLLSVKQLLERSMDILKHVLLRGVDTYYRTWGWGVWTPDQQTLVRQVSLHSFQSPVKDRLHPYSSAFEKGLTVGNGMAHLALQNSQADNTRYTDALTKCLRSYLNIDHTYANDIRTYMLRGGREAGKWITAQIGEQAMTIELGDEPYMRDINTIFRDSAGFALAIAEVCLVEKAMLDANAPSPSDIEYCAAYSDLIAARTNFSLADFQWDGISDEPKDKPSEF